MTAIKNKKRAANSVAPEVTPDATESQENIQELPQEKPVVRVSPVFGDMVHPYLGVKIGGVTEFNHIDSWLKAQIDAGKLALQ